MAQCKNLIGCSFFNDRMPIDKGIGALYKKSYCLGEYSKCARYLVSEAVGKTKVPATLYPNMIEKVEEVIAQG